MCRLTRAHTHTPESGQVTGENTPPKKRGGMLMWKKKEKEKEDSPRLPLVALSHLLH